MARRRFRDRPAFTLIEMVIVLSIILLLAILLMSAVMKVMGMVPEVQTRTEISQMDVALAAFMSDYNLSDPPPSLLLLREDMAYNPNVPFEVASLNFLKKTFGKNLAPTDWNGNLKIDVGVPMI